MCHSTWAGLTNLESLNLDSCKVSDEGIEHLKGKTMNTWTRQDNNYLIKLAMASANYDRVMFGSTLRECWKIISMLDSHGLGGCEYDTYQMSFKN